MLARAVRLTSGLALVMVFGIAGYRSVRIAWAERGCRQVARSGDARAKPVARRRGIPFADGCAVRAGGGGSAFGIGTRCRFEPGRFPHLVLLLWLAVSAVAAALDSVCGVGILYALAHALVDLSVSAVSGAGRLLFRALGALAARGRCPTERC